MMRGTFADWLMNQGVQFHPETVIVDMTNIHDAYNSGLHNLDDWAPINRKAKPPYKYMFFEWERFIRTDLSTTYGFYCACPDDCYNPTVRGISFIKFYGENPKKPYLWMAEQPFFYEINRDGFCDDYSDEGAIVGLDSGSLNCTYKGDDIFYSSFHEYHSGIGYEEQYLYYAHVAIRGIELLHQKAEVELVDWPRNYRRRELRKKGKEPSPYFRIIAPGKPEKRYPSNGKKSDNKIKLPLHTVRGHFRHVENHPLPQFNGTFWIPAHTRGDEKMGKLQKHYKIRLPQDSQQTA